MPEKKTGYKQNYHCIADIQVGTKKREENKRMRYLQTIHMQVY